MTLKEFLKRLIFKVNTYDFVNFRIISENRKSMQTLEEELQEEKAKRHGQEQSKLETREDREEIQGRQMYQDFPMYVKNFMLVCLCLKI